MRAGSRLPLGEHFCGCLDVGPPPRTAAATLVGACVLQHHNAERHVEVVGKEHLSRSAGDVACCLAALDHNLRIARVSAVQFFQPPRSQNALSVGEQLHHASQPHDSPKVFRLVMAL